MSYTYPEALNALEAIANDFSKTLRGRMHVPVRVICDPNAHTACVQWTSTLVTVHLPARPATSRMTEAEFQDWVAYKFHEVGHPAFTDLPTWHLACRQNLAQMTNAVEDVRMEKALINSKVAINGKAVLSRLVSRKIAEARADGWRPNSRKSFGWTIAVLGRAANGYDLDPADLAWIKAQIQPGSTVAKTLKWALPELASARNTQDCLTLAIKIMKALAVPSQGLGTPVSAPNGQGQGTQPESGKASQQGPQGQEEANGSGSGDTGEQDADKAEGENEGGGDDDSTGSSEAGSGGTGHGDGSNNSDEQVVTGEQDLDTVSLAPKGETMTRGQGTEARIIEILRDNAKHDGKPASSMQAVYEKARASGGTQLKATAARASKQRALLARALRANEQDDREGGRRHGRLDQGALTRAMAGSVNVFTRRDIAEGFDTDVHVLIDGSGSMGGAAIYKATDAAMIVAQAAASVGASCTIELFNTNGFVRAGDVASKRQPDAFALARLNSMASSGTPLSTHMARSAHAQAKRAPQKRRVLFVITDGGCDYGTETVKAVAGYCEKVYGTVMAHVSIGTMLQGAFKAEVRVEHGQSIVDVGLGHFVKVLQAL